MFKKHIIVQILYIIVGPLCPASLKCLIFYKILPSDKHSMLWLASWHTWKLDIASYDPFKLHVFTPSVYLKD